MSYKEVTDKEYKDWLNDPNTKIIEPERCVFSGCCGPHEFSTIIEKHGIQYLLSWGWGWDLTKKEKCSYSVKILYKTPCQEGDGI